MLRPFENRLVALTISALYVELPLWLFIPPVPTPVYCGHMRRDWPRVARLPINCLKFANGGLNPRATTAGSSMGLFSRLASRAYGSGICIYFTRSEGRVVPFLPG